MDIFKKSLVSLVAVGVLASGQCFSAESTEIQNDWLNDTFSVTVGGFFADTKTSVRIDASDGTLGTKLDLENALDLGSSDVSLDVGMMWRISRKHSLELEYFDIRRSSATTLNASINVGDTIYSDQVDVDSFLDTRVLRIGYGYSFLRAPTYELGLHLGVHVTKVETGISGITSGGISAKEVVGTTAPLPVGGLFGSYRLAERWVIFGRAQYFQLEFDKYDGKMTQFAIGIEHDTFKHISLGLAYRSFDIRVDIDETDWLGEIDFKYTGPILYFRYGF